MAESGGVGADEGRDAPLAVAQQLRVLVLEPLRPFDLRCGAGASWLATVALPDVVPVESPSFVRDRELKTKLTPRDQPMCKRMIFAGHYYRAVQKPGADIITDAINCIEPRGVITADGTLHEVDLLVLATGFDAHAYVRPLAITGEDGRTLDEVWADGPAAYRSVPVPGFPNMFMLMGPHAPVGNDSLIHVAENQVEYVMWWIDQLRAGRIVAAALTEAATKTYNDVMKAAMPQTVWTTGCRSWYLGKDGLPELFPWDADHYKELMRVQGVDAGTAGDRFRGSHTVI